MSAVAENLRILQGGERHDELPHSLEAEENLISTALLDATGGALAIAGQVGLPPVAFYSHATRTIWETLLDLRKRGELTDVFTVQTELEVRKCLQSVGGLEYLFAISNRVATAIQTRYFAETVKLLWERRYAISQGGELAERCAGQLTREEFSELAGELGQRLIRLGRRENLRSLGDVIDAVGADVTKRASGTFDKTGWIYTGIARFDEKCKPLGSQREDNYVIIAGGSGDGKSALLRQLTDAALEQKKRAKVYTRETSVDGFLEQMAASRARFDLNEPDRQPADRLRAFLVALERLKEIVKERRLWIVEQSAATPLDTVEDLAADARAHVNLYGPMDFWAVDYAQLLGTKRRFNNREQEMAHVSHTLQTCCRELGGVWAVGCQFNEAGLREMRTVKRDDKGHMIHRLPQRGDLRESQAFFHDGDRVEGLYRPPEDCRGQEQTNPNILNPEVWIVQMKRRRGGEGFVRCWFQKPYTRFAEVGVADLPPGDEMSRAPEKKAYQEVKHARPKEPPSEGPYGS